MFYKDFAGVKTIYFDASAKTCVGKGKGRPKRAFV